MFDWIYLLSFLLFILQVMAIVHVLRTGRAWWWILLIFLVPWLGLIAYGIVELLPSWQARQAGRGVPFGTASGSERESVRRLERELAESPTVENRSRLAAALLRRGDAARAVEEYEACLKGVYAEDRTLWYELAEACHAAGRHREAFDYLERLDAAGFRDYRDRRGLLRALSLEALGEVEEAQRDLEKVVATFSGQEANYHYARLLLKQGEREKARVVVDGMLERRGTHDARYRRREERWYAAARKLF